MDINGVVGIITLLTQELDTFYAPKISGAFNPYILESQCFLNYLKFGM